jgi:hypothetical protein
VTLAAFTAAYIEAALWLSTDESRDDGGDPLDKNYSADDLSDEARAKIDADCKAFYEAHEADINSRAAPMSPNCSAAERAGHDYWLNRNGHGCGFWDGRWAEPIASRLDAASREAGSCDIYVGDDGKLYVT